MRMRGTVSALCVSAVCLGTASWTGRALAYDPVRGPSFDNRIRGLPDTRGRTERDIRRQYNERNYLPSPAPSIRERHLRDGAVPPPVVVPPPESSASSCTRAYSQWKRTRSRYWRDRYYDACMS